MLYPMELFKLIGVVWKLPLLFYSCIAAGDVGDAFTPDEIKTRFPVWLGKAARLSLLILLNS